MISRIAASIRTRGLVTTLRRIQVVAFDHWFDARYRLRTQALRPDQVRDLTVVGTNKARGIAYRATPILPMRRALRQIQPLLPPRSVLVDLGCGKGRALMVAAELGFHTVRGIEFAPDLCALARTNCAAFKRATRVQTDFQIIESDVVDYAIRPDENVFFLYNPFDDVVLDKVLDNIRASLEEAPRRVLIIYHNPRFGYVLERAHGLATVLHLDFWGYRFEVYANDVAQPRAFVRPTGGDT
jgi:SAM-dependent methyltransferase